MGKQKLFLLAHYLKAQEIKRLHEHYLNNTVTRSTNVSVHVLDQVVKVHLLASKRPGTELKTTLNKEGNFFQEGKGDDVFAHVASMFQRYLATNKTCYQLCHKSMTQLEAGSPENELFREKERDRFNLSLNETPAFTFLKTLKGKKNLCEITEL